MAATDRGAGTALTAGIALGLVGVTFVGVVVLGYYDAHRTAADAADLAALAGAQAHAAARDGCAAARLTSRRNGTELRSCRIEGGPESFVVQVRTATPMKTVTRLPGLPTVIEADAWAGRGAQA